MAYDLRNTLSRGDIEKALSYLAAGGEHRFDSGKSAYQMSDAGSEHAPSCVVSIAAKWALGDYLPEYPYSHEFDRYCANTLSLLGYPIRGAGEGKSRNLWIETATEEQISGGTNWIAGSVLLSTGSKTSDFQDVKPGDLVLHRRNERFVGISEVQSQPAITVQKPRPKEDVSNARAWKRRDRSGPQMAG